MIIQKIEDPRIREFIARTLNHIEKYRSIPDSVRVNSLYLALSYAYFTLDDYEHALLYFNRIFNEPEPGPDFPAGFGV